MAAIVARRAAVDGLGGRGGAAVDDVPVRELFFDRSLEFKFGAGERNGFQKVTGGVVFQVVGVAADADHFLDPRVVRLNVVVSDGPVFTVAVVAGRLKIARAEAQRNQAPVQRLAPPPRGPAPRRTWSPCRDSRAR